MPAIGLNTINHVGIPIRDRRTSLQFYRALLGLEVIPSQVDNERIVWARAADGTMVHLIEPNQGQMVAWHVAFEVDDFDGTLARLKAEGFEVEGPGQRHDGQRYVFVRDPDGNRIELVTRGDATSSNRVCDDLGYTREAQ